MSAIVAGSGVYQTSFGGFQDTFESLLSESIQDGLDASAVVLNTHSHVCTDPFASESTTVAELQRFLVSDPVTKTVVSVICTQILQTLRESPHVHGCRLKVH